MSEDVKPYGAQPVSEHSTPEELRELIAKTGLSQRRAAEALDLSERMMRYYASGQEKIPRVVIYALRYLAAERRTAPPITSAAHSALTAQVARVEGYDAQGRDPNSATQSTGDAGGHHSARSLLRD